MMLFATNTIAGFPITSIDPTRNLIKQSNTPFGILLLTFNESYLNSQQILSN